MMAPMRLLHVMSYEYKIGILDERCNIKYSRIFSVVQAQNGLYVLITDVEYIILLYRPLRLGPA